MPQRFLTAFFLLVLGVSAVFAAETPTPSPVNASPELQPLLDAITEAVLEVDKAVSVGRLNLATGMAVLEVEKGTFFPATAHEGRVSEVVFLGKARLKLDPPNDVEAKQLELFTGHSKLSMEIDQAVFVLANDKASEAVFKRSPTVVAPELAAQATELYQSWKKAPERKVLDVDGAMLQDRLGDRLYQGYFAGWFSSEEMGKFLYLVEPDSQEQVTLGGFVPLELTEKEKRKLGKVLHKQQRQGRLIGVSLDDLGQWDTWLSSALVSPPNAEGLIQPAPGRAGFEAERYVLELTIADKDLNVSGRAQLQLRAETGLSKVARLGLSSELKVSEVRDTAGKTLPFRQLGGEVMVVLPEAPARDSTLTLEVLYAGKILEKVEGGVFVLLDTIHWHPHAGDIDRATYDVTFRWPERLELLAGGTRVDGGTTKGQAWERRQIDFPAAGMSFEVGKFHIATRDAGHVKLRLGMMPIPYQNRKGTEEMILEAAAESLTYFEEIFGPYPSDELTLVLTPRSFSQAMPGMVTLSAVMMAENGWLTFLLGLEDPATVIAHEIAHQWWGHRVGWVSYRDQWLSEALANYSSLLYARHQLEGKVRNAVGPTTGWQGALLAETEDGRPIESLGPLVLGARLESSRSGDAYSSIVYRKGAVVLDMLARLFTEKKFLEMLKKISEITANRAISTEMFLDALERISGQELDGFAQQYIYGTGLPEVYYRYEFVEDNEGKWKVEGTARQSAPYRFKVRAVAGPDGRFDISRERLELKSMADSVLIVPVQVAVYDPAKGGEAKGKEKKKEQEIGNLFLYTHVLLKGEESPLRFALDQEPKELWLDRRTEMFGRFFNERRHPKRMLYYQALDAAALARVEEAKDLSQRALAAELFAGHAYDDRRDKEEMRNETEVLDGQVHLLLAGLALDGRNGAEAARQIELARDQLAPGRRPWWKSDLELLEARLALQQGEAERAFKLLKKAVLKRGDAQGAEAQLLLAIAARASGHTEEEQKALKEAEEAGADVSALKAAKSPS